MFAHQRDDDENAEQAVDHAGHGREKIDQKGNDVADFARSKFGKEDRAGEAKRNGDQQGDGGRDQRAENERGSAVIIENRIPDAGNEKLPAERGPRKVRFPPKLNDQKRSDQENAGRKHEGNYVRHFIAAAKAVQKRTRLRGTRSLVTERSGCS